LWTTLEPGIWLSVEGAGCTGEFGAERRSTFAAEDLEYIADRQRHCGASLHATQWGVMSIGGDDVEAAICGVRACR
jgi:hypothetical protein